GGGDDPFADRDHERALFHVGQEGARRQQAALRMLPADQGFEADDLAAAHVYLGLVEQHELIACNGLAHPPQRLRVAAAAATGHEITSSRRLTKGTKALCSPRSTSTAANSSPPRRAMVSPSRKDARMQPARCWSRRSPSSWPCWSLTCLKPSRSR